MSEGAVEIVVFASGRGSNFDSITSAIEGGKLPAKITALVCDVPGAPVIEKARSKNIRVLQYSYPGNRKEHDHDILLGLHGLPRFPRFAVLAGYKRIFSPKMIEAFRSGSAGYSRIVNIHPSLLPAFPGLGSYRKAFEYGCKTTGVTVHLVDEEVDHGPICAQKSFSIENCKTHEEVEQRGLEIEHSLYPETLAWVLPEKFEIQGRRCVPQS